MSELKVDKITPRQGTTLTLGDSGDTINFGSGVLPNFENLTVTGDLTVDTNSLKVDSTNNFVGIGTATPAVALDVVGAITATGNITGTLATAAQPNITSLGTLTSATVSGDLTVDTNTLYVDSANNRVGVGTTSPATELEVNGGIRIPRDAGGFEFGVSLGGGERAGIKSNSENELIFNRSSAVESMRLTATGLGIGTSSPSYPLDILTTGGDASFRIKTDGTGINDDTLIHNEIAGTTGENFILFKDADGEAGNLRYDHNSNSFRITVNTSEAMRIDSSGKVGIGTSSPSRNLYIHGDDSATGGNVLAVRNNNSTAGAFVNFIAGGANAPSIGAKGNNIVFTADGYSGTEFLRILGSNGNVGIGTSSPAGNLHVEGGEVFFEATGNSKLQIKAGTSSNSFIEFGDADDGNIGRILYGHGVNAMTFNTNGSEAMRMDSSRNVLVGRTDNPSGVSNCIYALGNYGITTGSGANVFINSEGLFFRSTSSLRYKNTINDATHGLTELLTLRPVTYKGNNDGDTIFGGLIAEEVHDAGLTEFVQYNDDGQPDALHYGNMVSLCIKAIQELKTDNDALRTRIEALENA